MWLWLSVALAGEPVPVVAVGDALTAPSSSAPAPSSSSPGGWVAVLADCLEERAKGRYTVVDRAIAGQTPDEARAKLATILELKPGLVLVGVSPPKATDKESVAAFQAQLEAIGHDVAGKGAGTVLVGVVDPAGSDPRWNDAVSQVAKDIPGVVHVDLVVDWPSDPADRAALMRDGYLSEQGHARVGAAVCDAVLAWKAP